MSMRFVETIAYLDEYRDLPISCDNIDLSSPDRVVHLYNLISLTLEILPGDFFARISDGASRWHKFIGYE
jgi:hypothetical protein